MQQQVLRLVCSPIATSHPLCPPTSQQSFQPGVGREADGHAEAASGNASWTPPCVSRAFNSNASESVDFEPAVHFGHDVGASGLTLRVVFWNLEPAPSSSILEDAMAPIPRITHSEATDSADKSKKPVPAMEEAKED
jgi:hypothetical protein